MHTERKILIERLARVFADFPEVAAVCLVGSWAKGKAGKDGDIDLALVPTQTPGNRGLDILAALTAEGIDHVDLVTLDTDHVGRSFEAVSPKCLVYARADFDHGSFYSHISTLFGAAARRHEPDARGWSR